MLGAARNDGWLHDDVTQAAEQSISSAVNMDAIAFTNALRIGPPTQKCHTAYTGQSGPSFQGGTGPPAGFALTS
jgi:hypothetical protein